MVTPSDPIMGSLSDGALVASIPGDFPPRNTPPSPGMLQHEMTPNGDHCTPVTFSPGLVPSSSSSGSGSDTSSPKGFLSKASSIDKEAVSLINKISMAVDETIEGTDGAVPKHVAPTKRTPDDYIFEKVLGEGSFSTVRGLVGHL